MSIAVSVFLLILTVFVYRYHLHPRRGFFLFVLRLAVILLLVLILLGQIWSFSWAVRPKRLVCLVDRSQSMKAVGADTIATKLIRRLNVILAGKFIPEVWVFGDSVLRGENKTVGVDRTRIGRALELVGKTRPATIVLFSDGQDNGETDPVAIARDLIAPVYTIGCCFGQIKNIAVTGLDFPFVVYAGDTVRVTVRLAASGFGGGEQVTVKMENQLRKVVLGAGFSEQEVAFNFIPSSSGKKFIQVSVDSFPGEMNYQDNQRAKAIEVKPSRLNVVYITNRPGPQTRFILQSLRSEKRLRVIPVVAVTGNLGAGLSAVAQGQVFIIDGGVEMVADRQFWTALLQKVEAGAGVLILAAPEFRPGEVIKNLLPIKEFSSSVSGFDSIWQAQITDRGRALSLFNELDINSLPPFTGFYPLTPKEKVEVWLNSVERGEPLVVAYRIKRGRGVFLTAFPLWRWGFRPEFPFGSKTPLDIFLAGVVQYLGESDSGQFRLETDAPEYFAGEPVKVTLLAKTPDGAPWEGLDVRLYVDSVFLPMTEGRSGRYDITISGLKPGRHSIFAELRTGEMNVGRVESEVLVAEQGVELSRLGVNQVLLSRIAEASGGFFIPAESLNAKLEFKAAVYQRRIVFDPRRFPPVYGLVAVLFSLELLLRRKRGLL